MACSLCVHHHSRIVSMDRRGQGPMFRSQEIDPHVGEICYAVTVADVNGDQKLDIVAMSEDAVVWYENPGWRNRRHPQGDGSR